MSSPVPDLPPIKEYKSQQYEFNDEHNREISALADAMRVTSGLMLLVGLAFVVLAALTTMQTVNSGGNYGPAIGLGSAALLCLCIGFWTGGAATSFRKVVETKNEDIWHLMNALGSLRSMYGLLRTLIFGALVLTVIGLGLAAFALIGK
ncbi:hypothetical protein J8F10_23195 [Gemmata sp. G18]|uniref:Uncharacterized protein n=1 Tax=Gemmata palustris TaxID=2822762 RepID=A0ABS5BWU0_9BACT|nr:hypothetical protein [Gemmata palustris]MBP3958166.1 hypothetical protein [Gemmata palustris]